MPRTSSRRIPLAGLTLTEARSGTAVDLGALAGRQLLTAIRHRY